MKKILQGDALEQLKTLPDESVQTCITSPPYFGLRDYGVEGQIGLEETPELFVEKLRDIFHEVKRVLRNDGTLWLNLGDSYNGNDASGGGYSDKSTLAGFTNANTKGRQMEKINRAKDRSTSRWGGGQNKVNNLEPKNLMGIPWRVAFALQADGWYLRQDIIWAKPNPMPESVTDRCTKSHEYIFLMSKSAKYYFDNEAIKEDAIHKQDPRAGHGRLHYRGKREGEAGTGQENFVSIKESRNKRSVWTVTTKPYKEAHFATFPEELVEPMILAGSPAKGVVLDPFAGSGTTLAVAKRLNRQWVGIELNSEYLPLIQKRLNEAGTPMF